MRSTADKVVTLSYRLLSKQEVAKLLGYTTRTVDRLVAARKIPFTDIPAASGTGRKIKFDSRAIDAWIRGSSVVVIGGEDN